MKLITKYPVHSIFIIAIILRLSFSFYFQQFYFGEFVFKYRDTSGYLNPILNLINHGSYIGDFYLEDSKYFRVPVYPTFLGLIHLIFGGAYFDYAVAIIQSILDSSSAVLVYLIIFRVTSLYSMAFISGLIYATYPFVILWTPISYTDILQIFLIFILFYLVLLDKNSKKYAFFQGILIGLLILTKQYLGLLILVPMFIIFFSPFIKKEMKKKIILASMLIIGIFSILSPWVVRNYIESGRVIVLKGDSTGLRTRGLDFEAFEKFANLFNENITPMLNSIAYNETVTFDKHLEFVDKHKNEIDIVVKKAYQCGTSFMEIRMPTGYGLPHTGCNEEIIRDFEKLTYLFWREVPFVDAIETRMDAVKKIFMKSDIIYSKIEFSKVQLFKIALFKYRVMLVLLGMVGIMLILLNYVKNTNRTFVFAIAITAISFYIFFSLFIVHVEMRYILLPDILISMFASIPIVVLIDKIKNIKSIVNR